LNKKLDPICLSCKLYQNCVYPKVDGFGGDPEDVKAVLILSSPEKEDDNGNFFMGKRAMDILSFVGDERLSQCYVTYLVKCPTPENPVSRTKFREPKDSEVEHCMKHLVRELKRFPNATLMTFGSFSLRSITGDQDIKVSREAGIGRKIKIGPNTFTLIPNLDPGAIRHNPNVANEMKAHIEKLFTVANDENTDVSSRYKLMDFEESMAEMDRAIKLYKEGKINWIIFDYENSVSFDPWGGGEIIMSSFAHTEGEPGYVVPFYITNEVHHWKAHKEEEFNFEEYADRFPHNSKLVRLEDHVYKVPTPAFAKDGVTPILKDDGEQRMKLMSVVSRSYIVPDLPYDVPPVDIKITDKQRAKLTAKTKEMVETIPIAGHNLKYDMKWGAFKGQIDLRKVRIYNDTLNTSFQLNNKGPGIDNTLKGQSRKYLNVTDDWENKIDHYIGKFRFTEDRHFGQIPTGVLAEYSGLDSYYNKGLLLYYESIMPEEIKPITEMVTSAIIPFADSEIKGIAIDPKMYEFLKAGYAEYLEVKRDQIYSLHQVKKMVSKYLPSLEAANATKKKKKTHKELVIDALNFNNPAKIAELVYKSNYYALPENKKFRSEAGNYGVSEKVRDWFLTKILTDDGLEFVKKENPDKYDRWTEARQFINLYADFKRVSKLYNDYIMTMPKTMHNGLYKTSFNLNGTVTGRLSSPFHSMPKGCDIKRLITSRWRQEGGLILAADQSQIELRIAASLSGETRLIEAFNQGLDAHAVTAAGVYGIPVDQVTPAQRDVGKTCNFAMLYGKTKYNLATDLGIPVDEADRILRNFYASLHHFTEWANQRKKEVKESGYSVTVFGRRIPIIQAFSQEEYEIAEAERFSVNYPIQSSASDTVFDSALEIWKRKEEENLKSTFLATVHDNTLYDTYPGELIKMMHLYKEEGQDKLSTKYPWLICPLKLDFEIGVSWGGALKCELQHLDDRSVVFKAKGLKRDFLSLGAVAKRAYKFSLDKIEETDVDLGTFADDIFIRDNKRFKATVALELQ
jgi:uracil-DNA glycosylase family 4